MNITQEQIQQTKTFLKAEPFKKTMLLKTKNIASLEQIYYWAKREGIGYVKKNPNYNGTDVKIVVEIIEEEIKNIKVN